MYCNAASLTRILSGGGTFAGSLAVVGMFLGCSPDSCWQLEKGHTYSFVVREANLSSVQAPPLPPCSPPLVPSIGETLQFEVTKERLDEPEGCVEASGKLVSEHAMNVANRPARPAVAMGAGSGQTVITSRVAIDWDGCPGTWAVRALGFVEGNDPFVDYRPGRPAIVLYRSFDADSIFEPNNEALAAACRERPSCTDSFGVEVRK